MAEQEVKVLIEGGKATAAPPLGPALGPTGVNIGQVVADINKKTAAFKGMQVPVTVKVGKNKDYTISVGTPPASALIKKEAGVVKGAGNPIEEKVADLKIEQIIKIAKMKEDALLGADNKAMVKEVVGTCQSMGILVEGKPAHEVFTDINSGVYDEKIISGKTELSEEEKKTLEEERKHLEEELKVRRAEFERTAKEILESMKGKTSNAIKNKMKDAKIPDVIIRELIPEDDKADTKK